MKGHGNRLSTFESTYLGDDSVFEINRQTKHGAKLSQLPDAELSEALFDGVLEQIDQDLARALQTLWSAPIFKVFVCHRAMINAANALEPPKQHTASSTVRIRKVNNEAAQADIRRAYGSETPLRLRRHFETGSPYAYKVTQPDDEEPLGYAKQTGEHFLFFDLAEQQLLSVEAAALLGKTTAVSPEPMEVDDDDMAGSGCCSPARSRSSSRASTVLSPEQSGWFVKSSLHKADGKSNEFGPVSFADLQDLWKYHLLPEEANVRHASGESAPIKELLQYFSPAKQIQVIDPTMLEQ